MHDVGGAYAAVLTAAVVLLVASLLLGMTSAKAAVTVTPNGSVPSPWFSGHAGLYAWGAATMPDGSVLIGDYRNYRVAHYSENGAFLGSLIDTEGSAPHGLGVDPRNGDVYVADTERDRVRKYDNSGTFIDQFGLPGKGVGRFEYPSRVAVGSDGRVYVADTMGHNIVVHDEDGNEDFQFGTFGTGDGQLKQPHGMAFDYGNPDLPGQPSDDRLYVVDTLNYRVQVFNPEGQFLFKFGSKGTAVGKFDGDVRGLAIDQADNLVYVVDAHGNRVHKFTLAGNHLLTWGSKGEGPGQFADGGREVTVDGDGDVWVADMPNYRVQEFSPTGQFIRQRPDPVQLPPDGGFNGPRGVAVDSLGNIWVSDTYNQRLQKLASDGTFLGAWGARGGGDESFNYPRMLAVDPRNDDVVIADTDNHRIKKYDNDGDLIWISGTRGTGLGQFIAPHGIDVGPDGSIWVADTNNFRIQKLDPDGTPVLRFGSKGTGNRQFMLPRGIAVDPIDGSVWVADAGLDRIKHFSANGDFLSRFGTTGKANNQFANPFDLEVDDTNVYIADPQVHKVKIWTKTGTFQQAFGGLGPWVGKLNMPQGLDLGPDGKLFVAEQINERIQRFILTEDTATSAGTVSVASADGSSSDGWATSPARDESARFVLMLLAVAVLGLIFGRRVGVDASGGGTA